MSNLLERSMRAILFLLVNLFLYARGEPIIWAVTLSHTDHMSVANDLGLNTQGPVSELLNDIYEFHLTERDHMMLTRDLGSQNMAIQHTHTRMLNHRHVKWAELQTQRHRVKREVKFNDPSFYQQWHLVNHQEKGHDINVSSVWLRNITGLGVTVAVVDDGLQHRNSELSDNYNAAGSYDFNDHDDDPTPDMSSLFNSHGTRCAGLVASVANNSVCGVGVAFNSSISGIRLLDGTITDLLEAKALTYKTHINHIYSCSWGPTDDGVTVEAPGTLAQLALKLGTEHGRYGYGSVFVFASGNGGSKHDNCNFDGYSNSVYTVTIGAVDELDKKPYYAEDCAAKFAVTYSNGVKRGDRNIVTADITKSHSCTKGFSGTSAAAPMAAGVIALALQVRPCLTWRDIQSVIVYSAVPIDIADADWSSNGANFRHSHQHGFGVLDAYRLTMTAQAWPLLPPQTIWHSDVRHTNMPISTSKIYDNLTLLVSDLPSTLHTLEHVAVTVTIDHTYRGAIVVDLISPSGTVSHLATSRKKDSSSKGLKDWTFTTVRCWGEDPVGVWSLQVQDNISVGLSPTVPGEPRGYLIQWSLTLYGNNLTSKDVQDRRQLVVLAVNEDDSITPSQCPPHPTNLQEITFPDSPLGNKFLKILSALAAVVVTILFLHLLLTFIYYKLRDRKIYRITLPAVLLNRSNSTAEEEEVLLLEEQQKEENDWTDTRPSNGDNDSPEPASTTL